jgi:nucleoside-diphosphate-sugar epimerase
VVIHCAAVVPKTDIEAEDAGSAASSVGLVRRLIAHAPARIMFPSTRTGGGAYLHGKRRAERLLLDSGVPVRVLRFPGLFGPPRQNGLVYTVIRALQQGEPFTPSRPLHDWTGMRVTAAADACWRAAHSDETGVEDVADHPLEDILAWVRSSSGLSEVPNAV